MTYGTTPSSSSQPLSRSPSPSSEIYSTFSPAQKRIIILLTGFTSMFSPLSGSIYFPAITFISRDLAVSIELINLTITSYMIIAGIAPTLLGDLADQIGRRPIYLCMMLVYMAANTGLAVQSSYPALLVLRMLQSFGSSATIAISYGVVSDIASPAERGAIMGIVQCGPNLALLIGPVFGGLLAENFGWRSIFWTLSFLSAICFLSMTVFFPETSRRIVGNALIMLSHGTFYTTSTCILASLSSLFISVYSLSGIQAGLIYLPLGLGCLMASYFTGQLLNRDYRVTAKKHGLEIDLVKGDDVEAFPIEEARLRSVWVMILGTAGCVLGYGWAVEYRSHIFIPLSLLFFAGATITGLFNALQLLLVDLHPDSPATAQAALNMIRCTMSALGLAALQLVIDSFGPGWCFSMFTVVILATLPLLWMERSWGMGWRMAKHQKISLEDEGEETLLL